MSSFLSLPFSPCLFCETPSKVGFFFRFLTVLKEGPLVLNRRRPHMRPPTPAIVFFPSSSLDGGAKAGVCVCVCVCRAPGEGDWELSLIRG